MKLPARCFLSSADSRSPLLPPLAETEDTLDPNWCEVKGGLWWPPRPKCEVGPPAAAPKIRDPISMNFNFMMVPGKWFCVRSYHTRPNQQLLRPVHWTFEVCHKRNLLWPHSNDWPIVPWKRPSSVGHDWWRTPAIGQMYNFFVKLHWLLDGKAKALFAS